MELKTMPTRQLLGFLANARTRGGDYETEAEYQARRQEMDDLRAELATREHIPSKLEGKLARQQAAKAARGQGKGKGR